MPDFFSKVSPGGTVTHGNATFDLPILYFRDDLFLLFFSGDLAKLKSLMPSDKLHPVRLSGTRGMVGIAAFNYIDTSIGPYGEVGVVVPCVYGDKPAPPVWPALREGKYPGFGTLVLHLPVTKTLARDAGRGEWGYTKFVADMKFLNTPEYMQVVLSEGPERILTMRAAKKGFTKKDERPLVTYSVKDGRLIKTTIPQTGTFRFSLSPAGSFLDLGEHAVAGSIRGLGLSVKPIMSRVFLDRSGILPAGETIEEGVRPLEGYYGDDHEGEHSVSYREGDA